jgi:hypothetical protein
VGRLYLAGIALIRLVGRLNQPLEAPNLGAERLRLGDMGKIALIRLTPFVSVVREILL